MTGEDAERLARIRIYAAADHVTGDEADRADAIADMENAEAENGLAFLLRLLDAGWSEVFDANRALDELTFDNQDPSIRLAQRIRKAWASRL